MFNLKSLFKRTPEEKKAYIDSGISSVANLFQLYFGSDTGHVYSPKELLKYNVGWTAACLNKNAQTLSSIPLKLYYRKSNGQTLKESKNRIVTKSVQKVIRSTYRKEFDELVEITEHPVLELINHPNERMNWTDLMILSESYLGLIGNAYLYKQKNAEGVVEKIYPLLSENVSVIVNSQDFRYGNVQGYKYTNDADPSKSITFTGDSIIHLLNVTPGSVLYGRGELEQCLSCAEREVYYDMVENYLNKNNARPDFLVSYTAGIKENEQKELMKMWYKKYGSPKNAGKPIIASGDVKLQQLGWNPRDMQYKSGRDAVRQEIASVFGVPEALLVINESNFASAKSAVNHYMEFTIKPKLTRFLEKINEQLVSTYDPNLFLWWDGEFNASQDALDNAQLDEIYIRNGVYDAAYVRSRMGIQGIAEDEEQEVEVEEEPVKTEVVVNEE